MTKPPPPGTASTSAGPTLARVLGWGGFGLTALLGLTSGVGGVLVMAGTFAFVAAIVALVRGRVRWAHLHNRALGALALVASLVVMGVGGSLTPAAVSAGLEAGGGGEAAARHTSSWTAPAPRGVSPTTGTPTTSSPCPRPCARRRRRPGTAAARRG